MTTIETFACNPFQTNCFVAHSDGEAVLVDASSSTASEHAQIERYIQDHGLVVKELLLTHSHLDHIYGCPHFEQVYGLPWRIHADAVPLLQQASLQAMMFGAPDVECPNFATTLTEDTAICFGSTEWRVEYTPGHAPGSVCFIEDRDDNDPHAIVGDVLFANSIGRTDLVGGSLPVLMQSIHQKLMVLDGSTKVYCGHGPSTTIGHERRHNPFLQ